MTLLYLITFLLLSVLEVQGRPQADCDPIFGDCDAQEPTEECDNIFDDCDETDNLRVSSTTATTTTAKFKECEIFGTCGSPEIDPSTDCFNSANEIDDAIRQGTTRSVFNDCDNSRPCSFYARQGYSCANPWNCNENRTIITDGKGLIDVRQAEQVILDISDTKCDKDNQICCQKPNFRLPAPPTLSDQPEEEFIKEASKFEKCGRSSPGKISITGGDEYTAQPTEFPHMCVIYRQEDGHRVYVGGASLIAKNKVITVAHKFKVKQGGRAVDWTDKLSIFTVRCGEYNVKEETELLEAQESQVADIYIHPEYNQGTVFNNLAILRTEKNFIYQEHIGPVCLPRPNEAFDNEKGVECYSSGWGADQFSTQATFSDGLRKVKMGVINNLECQGKLQESDRFKNKRFKLHESWMCIGGEAGKDTCKGDGGSPHVCKDKNGDFIQVGAVAWGVECGKPIPSVYSSIPNAMCWIDWVMSCFGDADDNIGDLFTNSLDLRQDNNFPSSINKITRAECQDWMDTHLDLGDRCTVIYENVDLRNNF